MKSANRATVPALAGVLLAVLLAGPPVGLPGGPSASAAVPSAPMLTDAQVDALLLAAEELATDLHELRSLPRDAEHAERILAARERAGRSLESLLEAAGLTKEELTRLIDAGSVQRSVEETGEPILRPLDDARR